MSISRKLKIKYYTFLVQCIAERHYADLIILERDLTSVGVYVDKVTDDAVERARLIYQCMRHYPHHYHAAEELTCSNG